MVVPSDLKSLFSNSLRAAVTIAASMGVSMAANATSLTLNGLTFTRELGDFTVYDGYGMGLQDNPIVLFQDVTGPNVDLIMGISGLNQFNLICGQTCKGFYLTTIVKNSTNTVWNFYDHELQEILGIPSSEGDGLSFAQSREWARPFTADKFSTVDEITEDRDFINFSSGTVGIGESVIFRYVITDNTPLPTFYLRYRPNYQLDQPASTPQSTEDSTPFPSEEVPEPSSIMGTLAAMGILGMGALKKYQCKNPRKSL